MTDRVLIITGERNLRGELTSVLTEAGFVATNVPDYFESLLNEFQPDIAIIDEALPTRDGKDVCYELTDTFGIPVILLGVGSGGECVLRAVEAGADCYLRKPVYYREAVARVKAILRRYKKVAR